MKLSVIVPVYQAATTLCRCIDSIFSQTFSDWELILVDDGSTDGSGAICDEYVAKDARVQVVHHSSNKGLSEARNKGLRLAKGMFVTFLDSDDFIHPDTYQHVFHYVDDNEELEIIEFPVYVHYGHESQQFLRFDNIIYPDSRSYWLDGRAYAHSYACNKVYRRHLFMSVQFPKGYKFEDVWTLPLLLRHDPIVMTISEGLYYYCWNTHSITVQATGEDLKQLLHAQLTAARKLKVTWFHDEVAHWYLYMMNIQLDVCQQCREKPELATHRLPLNVAATWRTKFKVVLLNTLGLHLLCILKRIVS